MNRKTAIAAEVCPGCGSPDVQVVESWFHVDVDRRDELSVDAIEFGCRDCGISWS